MPTSAEEIHAGVGQRFAQVARSPDQDRRFPVGPSSAKKLGYGPQEIDALPSSVTESFCALATQPAATRNGRLTWGRPPGDERGAFSWSR